MLDRNLAENISRVLYPNDNVSGDLTLENIFDRSWLEMQLQVFLLAQVR